MPPILYDLTVPVYIRALENLLTVLKKGEEHAKQNGYEVDKLVEARIAPDMNVPLPTDPPNQKPPPDTKY